MKTLKVLFVATITMLIALGLNSIFLWVEPPVVERVVEKPHEKKDLMDLVQTIPPRYNVNPLVVATIIMKESGGKRDAVRYEPGQLARARKLTKNESEAMQLASSHGPMQVMGWWSREFNISWADLYDESTNIEVGSAILKKCLDRHHGKDKIKQLHSALTCYNGSEAYANAVMQSLGETLIRETL